MKTYMIIENFKPGETVSNETIKDAGAPLLIILHNDSFIQIHGLINE
jgi:hypothetical protein